VNRPQGTHCDIGAFDYGNSTIVNDFDTTGVFRPSNGMIFLKNTNSTGFANIALNYGLPGDKPIMGDWNNDGMDTIGIYRNGTFYLRNSNSIGFADLVFALGINGDLPIAGNWDNLPK
jgi:lysyl endopeptidase